MSGHRLAEVIEKAICGEIEMADNQLLGAIQLQENVDYDRAREILAERRRPVEKKHTAERLKREFDELKVDAGITALALERGVSRDRATELYREGARTHLQDDAKDAPAQDPLAITYDELVADRPLFDRVLRVVSMNRDLDYLGAIEWLEQQWALTGERQDTTLARVIEESPVSFDRFTRDCAELADREQRRETSLADRDDLPPAPEGKVRPDGRVELAGKADRAHLLVDATERERAYIEARTLDPNYYDRAVFDREYDLFTREGLDLVGTLQYRQREFAEATARARSEQRQRAWEAGERQRRAEAREKLDRVDRAIRGD